MGWVVLLLMLVRFSLCWERGMGVAAGKSVMGMVVCPPGAHLIRRIAVQDIGETTIWLSGHRLYTHMRETGLAFPMSQYTVRGKTPTPPAKSD